MSKRHSPAILHTVVLSNFQYTMCLGQHFRLAGTRNTYGNITIIGEASTVKVKL